MIRLRHKLLIHFLRLFDQTVALTAFALVANLFDARVLGGVSGAFGLPPVVIVLGLGLASMVFFNHFVRYDSNRFTALGNQIASLVKAITATSFVMLAVGVVFGFPALDPSDVLAFWFGTVICLAASRVLVRQLLLYSRRSGMTSRQLLIVGSNLRAQALAARFDECPELGYRILGFISEQSEDTPAGLSAQVGRWRVCGRLDDLKDLLQKMVVDEILICLPVEDHFPTVLRAVRLGQELGVVVRLVPDDRNAPLLRRVHVEEFDGQRVLTFFREHLLFQLMMKRLLDVAASAALLVVLSPLLLAVAILIKLGSPGPVFFVQERVGMNRRRFRLYKFRSMGVDAEIRKLEFAHLNEMDGPVFKIAKDPRVTPFGRVIRRTSIDELPQLFNVLTGTMSLVGPRPPVPSEVEQYDWLFQRRLSIKPGITCLWQVSGRNQVSFKEWMELDRKYVENWSLWLDIKILLRTVPVVLLGRGAS